MVRTFAAFFLAFAALVLGGCDATYMYVKVGKGDGTPVPKMLTPPPAPPIKYSTRREFGEWEQDTDASGRECRKSPLIGKYRPRSDEVRSAEQIRLCDWTDDDGAVCSSRQVSTEIYKREGLNTLKQEYSDTCDYVWEGRKCERGVRADGRSFDTCAINLKPHIQRLK